MMHYIIYVLRSRTLQPGLYTLAKAAVYRCIGIGSPNCRGNPERHVGKTSINIARAFSLIFVDSVPLFTDSESDQCRRFISLIDMLYDQQRSVVILAQFPINELCQIKKFSKEFERTSSRLYEMTIITQKK